MKQAGIYALHLTGKRYLGVFLDPVMSCNFRCKMCYFSDPVKRKSLGGRMEIGEIEKIAKSLFHRAIKLQIGCGGEPSLYKNLTEVIGLGKKYGVPYISLTTNGNLLSKDDIIRFIEAGLDEITLSAHGITKETYETLMVNGKYEIFCQLLTWLSEIKQTYPKFKIRINYTINDDNLDELAHFFSIFSDIQIDILQLRPIQQIGDSEYQNFNIDRIYQKYDEIIEPVKAECVARNITCLSPTRKNLIVLESDKTEDNSITDSVYCYVSATCCWKDGFDPEHDTYESYSKRTGLGLLLFKEIFRKKRRDKKNVTKKMNYSIN